MATFAYDNCRCLRKMLCLMVKFLVAVAAIGIATMIFAVFVAPTAPDGSFINELGADIRDSMSSLWGNPVTIENPRIVPPTISTGE